jgi:polyphosphate kinase
VSSANAGDPNLKLIIEPDDGAAPLLAAIKKAKKSVEITIFRFDRDDIEAALKTAVGNGVKVNVLIAHTNRGDERNLRKLEMRFLEAGIIVARSGDDLTRYHDKLLIIDRRVLYMLSFNHTRLDIDHSRGFGIVSNNPKLVQEAVKLFEADCARRPYNTRVDTFVVSPVNSRRVLCGFLKGAKRQLLIYDPRISDKQVIRILQDRAKAGVEVRIIGRIRERANLSIKKLTGIRLHTQAIIRDRQQAFVGSQSLRPAELDSRREVGLIVHEAKVVKGLVETFESDWASRNTAEDQATAREAPPAVPKKDAKKALQVFVKELRPLTTTVKKAAKKAVARGGVEVFEDKQVRDTVKGIVKKAVKKAVKEAVREAAWDTKNFKKRI